MYDPVFLCKFIGKICEMNIFITWNLINPLSNFYKSCTGSPWVTSDLTYVILILRCFSNIFVKKKLVPGYGKCSEITSFQSYGAINNERLELVSERVVDQTVTYSGSLTQCSNSKGLTCVFACSSLFFFYKFFNTVFWLRCFQTSVAPQEQNANVSWGLPVRISSSFLFIDSVHILFNIHYVEIFFQT